MSEQSLDELLKDIPSEKLEQQCSERFLADVAKHIVTWETMAPYFNIDRGEKQSIKRSCSSIYDEQKQEFLFKWKENNSKAATIRALLQAIYDSKNGDLVDKVRQLLQLVHCQAKESGMMAVPTVSPMLLEFQSKLKMKYSTHNPVMVTEWPPPCSLEYIKLVLIPKRPIDRGEITDDDVYAKMCQRFDEDMDASEEAEIDVLLAIDKTTTGKNKRKVILFEGAPGSGKSTLLWHICQMWQSGEQFQQYILVLLVQLKDPAVHRAKSLADLLHPRSRSEQVASEIEAIHGEGVLIMLDGWDEAPAELRKEGSFFNDLIARPSDSSVEKAVILVASRPLVFSDLWVYLSDRIELQGFRREMREKYLRETLTDKPGEAQHLIEKIESIEGSNTMDLSLPLNIASLIHIFRATGGNLPPTPCRMAITLVLMLLYRHIKKAYPGEISVEQIKSFEDLPHPIDSLFQHICKIAYDGIVHEKLTFTSEELMPLKVEAGSSQQIASKVATLSLLHPMHSLVSVGSSTVYHFLHLSHQELCAAYYVSTLPDPEKTHFEALNNILATRQIYGFECVGKFYSALTGLNIPSIANKLKFLYSLSDKMPESSDESSSHNLDQSGESDMEDHPDDSEETNTIGSDNEELENDNSFLSESGCVATLSLEGYLYPLFLEFAMESMNPKFIDDSVGKEAKLHIDRDTEATFTSVISMASSVESLTYYMHIVSSKIFNSLKNKQNLRTFVLHAFCCINDCGDFEAMKKSLQTCPNLKEVVMRVKFSESVLQLSLITQIFEHMKLNMLHIDAQNSIDDAKFAVLAPAFVGTYYAWIRCKEVGSIGLQKLKNILLERNSITLLQIKIEQYGGEDMEFFSCLRKAPSINTISFLNKDWGDTMDWDDTNLHDREPSLIDSAVGRVLLSGDLVELAEIFGLNDSPPVVDKTLHIHIFNSCLKIDFKNECFKTVSLVHCEHMKNRWCGHKAIEVKNKIKLSGINKLCISMQSIAVEEINLSAHKIGDQGAILLKDAIPSAMCLNGLILRECDIGEEGIAAVFSSLKHNKRLTKLDVAYNNFGDRGAITLAQMINQTSLEILDIGSCGIGEEGVAEIAAAMQTNTTLKRLGLYCDNELLTQCSERELSKMLLHNRTLSVLQVNQPKGVPFYSNIVYRTFNISIALMDSLLVDHDAREVYHAVKVSSVIYSIGVDRASSLGQALDSGNFERARDILQLNEPPNGKGEIIVNMDNGSRWTVSYVRQHITKN